MERPEELWVNGIEGLDTNTGQTPGTELRTIGKALELAQPWALIRIKGMGEETVYDENLDILTRGVRLQGYDDVGDKSAVIKPSIENSSWSTVRIGARDVSLGEKLVVHTDNIGVGGARTLADTLGGDGYDGNLRHFNINGNPVCNEGGMHLARMLLSNRTLQAVDFGNTQLGTEAVIALATVLKTQPFVEEINLDGTGPACVADNAFREPEKFRHVDGHASPGRPGMGGGYFLNRSAPGPTTPLGSQVPSKQSVSRCPL